ncbi:MAG: hypothetical protein ACPG5P_02800 [Saprospiraceae bacterium]
MKKRNRLGSVLKYIYKFKKGEVFVAIGIFSLIFILVVVSQTLAGKAPNFSNFVGLKWWTEAIDPLIGVAVFVMTIFLWYAKNDMDWENKLEKRLTVGFVYDGDELLRCIGAYLAGEGDIRAWGMQIGAQMSGRRFLKLEPNIKYFKPQIIEDRSGKLIKLYRVEFELGEKPIPDKLITPSHPRDFKCSSNQREKEEYNKYSELKEQDKKIVDKRYEKEQEYYNDNLDYFYQVWKTIIFDNGCIVWLNERESPPRYYTRIQFDEVEDEII